MSFRLFLSVLAICVMAAPATPQGGPLAAEMATKANWQAEYEELVAKAKQEGEVVVYGGSGRERRRARTEPFEQKYGIKVSYVGGATNEVVEKIRAEQAAGVFQGDVYFGRPPEIARLLKEKAMAPLKPLLFLPEVTDTSKFYQGKHWYSDPEQLYGQIHSAYQSNVISFNTKRINAERFQSMWDLFKPEFKGRIIITEPEPGSGASGVLVWMYVNKKLGANFIRRLLTETNPTYQPDCRQQVDLLAKGPFDFGLFCFSDMRRGQRQGLPVANRAEPVKEGSVLAMGGSNATAVLARAPHPNAQKLYVNWWFSREGQIAFQKLDREYQSVRNDIPIDPVPEERRRKPDVDYVYPDAEVQGAQWANEANDLWWSIRKTKR